MANVKISALDAGGTLTGEVVFPGSIGGDTFKFTADQIATFAGGGTPAGDIDGPLTMIQVVGLRGLPLSLTTPTNGQVLTWNGSQWIPTTPAVSTLAGDVTGAIGSNTVEKIRGITVTADTPVIGQVLKCNASGEWEPGQVQLGGDVTGASNSVTVQYIQNRFVAATAPSTGQVLTWNGSQWAPATPSTGVTGSGTANHVAFWSGAAAITGEAELYYNPTSNKLGVGSSTLIGVVSVHSASQGSTAGLTLSNATNSVYWNLYDDSNISTIKSGIANWIIGTDYAAGTGSGTINAASKIVLKSNNGGGDVLCQFERAGTVVATVSRYGWMRLGGTDAPNAIMHVSGAGGHSQLLMADTFTPSGSADSNGATGCWAWDANYVYVKTGAGWKRAALSTF